MRYLTLQHYPGTFLSMIPRSWRRYWLPLMNRETTNPKCSLTIVTAAWHYYSLTLVTIKIQVLGYVSYALSIFCHFQCFFFVREKVQVFREIFVREYAWKPILCVKFYFESMRETQFCAWKFLQKIHAWNLNRHPWKKVKNSLRESRKPCVKKIEESFSNFKFTQLFRFCQFSMLEF